MIDTVRRRMFVCRECSKRRTRVSVVLDTSLVPLLRFCGNGLFPATALWLQQKE